ncbi:MAG: C39 family peptidase [Lachnospiraceae bacterium]
MKKPKKNSRSHSGCQLFEKLAVYGIILSAMTLAISLFYYFYPLVGADVKTSISTALELAETTVQTAEAEPPDGEYQAKDTGDLRLSDQAAAAQAIPSETDDTPASIDELVADRTLTDEINGLPMTDDQTDLPLTSLDINENDPAAGENSRMGIEPEAIPHASISQELGNISELNADNSANYEHEAPLHMVMLDTALGPMLYYNQGDKRWGNYLYGGADPMKKYGCGPTAVAMIVSSFSPQGYHLTPIELANWAAANGGYAPQSGSYHSMIPKSLSAFGIHAEGVEPYSEKTAAELLRSGHILVALMGKGALTNNGHFVIITKILDNGNVYIADPNSFENSTKEWNLAQLMNELKGSYNSGGPLWAVRLK